MASTSQGDEQRYVFFVAESATDRDRRFPIDKRYFSVLWRPSVGSVVPRGVPILPFAVWWLMHHLRLFANRDYALFAVYDGETIIHRSCVFPRYFRFPFMSREDLQIGDTWTAEEHRGDGIACFALQQITHRLQLPARRFWYVTSHNNHASIRVAEKVGLRKVGEGRRTKRFGIRVIGSFVIDG